MDCYVFLTEPTQSLYTELMDFCCSLSTTMILIVRDPDMEVGQEIERKLAVLKPFLLNYARVKEWPGTVLYDDEAALYRYRVSEGLRESLTEMASGLFEWVHPDAPEDPCFLRANDEPLLVTISHEQEGYLLLTPDEFGILGQKYPMLTSVLRVDA